MDGWQISDGVPFAPQALNALDKLEAARSWSTGGTSSTYLMWMLLVLGALLAGVLVAGVVLLRGWARARRQKAAFAKRVRDAGLGEGERQVLAAMVRAAHPRNIESIFTVPTVFERGLTAMMRGSRLARMSNDKKAVIADLAESVRQKLGIHKPREASREGPAAEAAGPTVAQGDKLSVVYRGQPASLEVEVTAHGPGELVVRPAQDVRAEMGEVWLVRHTHEGKLWEFDAPVLRCEEGKVVLAHTGETRGVNRRRFPRVPTAKVAHLASLPFWKTEMGASDRKSVEGRLVEIGGPGMRLQAPVHTRVGERVLVAVQFGQGDVVEALGKVRRVAPGEGNDSELVVELIGLNEDEVAKLSRETNAAARAEARSDTTEDDAQAVLPAEQEALAGRS